ncbi:MAG TPA: YrdB family protein [Gaiellales bacterium]|nr:YrdB family protein [Gaiellales bacterium]
MAFRGAVLTVRFLCELGAVAAVAYGGYRAAGGIAGVILGAVLAVALMAFWATFLAPRRRIDLPLAARLVLELGVWTIAAAALWSTGRTGLAALLFTAAVATGAANATFQTSAAGRP